MLRLPDGNLDDRGDFLWRVPAGRKVTPGVNHVVTRSMVPLYAIGSSSTPKFSAASRATRASSASVRSGRVDRAGELGQLLGVVDVRQRRDDARLGEQPLERRLAERHALREKVERADLLQAVHEPRPRPMPAVVVRREDGVLGVFPLEHPRRMRHANVEDAVRRMRARRLDHRRSGMLLEDVPDHLDRVDVRFPLEELDRLVEPPDGRTERRTPRANLPFPPELAQRLPDRRVAHVLHLHVVQLEHVDVVRLQPLETLVDGKAHVRPARSAAEARSARDARSRA